MLTLANPPSYNYMMCSLSENDDDDDDDDDDFFDHNKIGTFLTHSCAHAQ